MDAKTNTLGTHGTLAAALAAAQAQMSNVLKDSQNPHFRSSFASLAAVREVVVPALAAQGIAVVQMPGNDDSGRVTITTVLLHGEEQLHCGTVATTATVRGGNEAQALGSALTYLRRYALSAIAGVAQEDDDGNASGPRGEERPRHREPSPRPPQRQTPSIVGEAKAMLRQHFGADVEDAEAFARDTVDKPLLQALVNPGDCKVMVAALKARGGSDG